MASEQRFRDRLNWFEELEAAIPWLPAQATIPVVCLAVFGILLYFGWTYGLAPINWLGDAANHYLPRWLAIPVKLVLVVIGLIVGVLILALVVLLAEKLAKTFE